MYCFNNLIELIDLSDFKQLNYLQIDGNKIKYLDISQNIELVQFNISQNEIKKLDITNNVKLDFKILYFDDFVEIIYKGKQINTVKKGPTIIKH